MWCADKGLVAKRLHLSAAARLGLAPLANRTDDRYVAEQSLKIRRMGRRGVLGTYIGI